MLYASDFRRTARENLHGRWGIAILAGLIVPTISIVSVDVGIPIIPPLGSENTYPISVTLPDMALPIILFLLFALLCVSMVLTVGYARLHLDICEDSQKPRIRTLFSFFSNWKNLLHTQLLQLVNIGIRWVLFMIPGILAMLEYSMVPFILAESPHLPAREVLQMSARMMEGKRWRFFCLQFSFIWWRFLLFPVGIAVAICIPFPWSFLVAALLNLVISLFLKPYQQAASAAFYRNVSGTYLRYDAPRETTAPENPQ